MGVGITVGDRKISNIFGNKPAALAPSGSASPAILRFTQHADGLVAWAVAGKLPSATGGHEDIANETLS